MLCVMTKYNKFLLNTFIEGITQKNLFICVSPLFSSYFINGLAYSTCMINFRDVKVMLNIYEGKKAKMKLNALLLLLYRSAAPR